MARRKALFWHERNRDNRVQCDLCPHGCRIKEGEVGLCRVRKNEGGELYTLNYGEIGAIALDPVEKKPLYHFFPGRNILSVGTTGCNLACGFCQNYSLAHGTPPTSYASPEQLVATAVEVREQGSLGLAYTYSEPGMWYEYVLDTARLAHSQGLKNVLVTNGYIEEEPLRELLPYIDAMNIDLKAFNESFYRHTCRGRLAPVMRTIKLCREQTHVEVTTLLVPGLNDSPGEIEKLATWLASLDPNLVLHLSRYHPAYRFRLPPTPVESLAAAREIARRFLNYVYVGNIGGFDNNTRCPSCGNVLIRRDGYLTSITGEKDGHCSACGAVVAYKA